LGTLLGSFFWATIRTSSRRRSTVFESRLSFVTATAAAAAAVNALQRARRGVATVRQASSLHQELGQVQGRGRLVQSVMGARSGHGGPATGGQAEGYGMRKGRGNAVGNSERGIGSTAKGEA